MSCHVATARFCTFVTICAVLISIGGGALPLPIFKSAPWLVTQTSSVGLYGACPADSIDYTLWSFQSNYKELLGTCEYFQGDIPGMLPMFYSIVVLGLYGVAVINLVLSMFVMNAKRPKAGMLLTLFGFIFLLAAVTLAIVKYLGIIVELNQGISNLRIIVPDYNARFGIGLYLSAGSVLLLIVSLGSMIRAHVDQSSFQKERWGY